MSDSVFISYSRRNRPFAEQLYRDLKRAGIDVWIDLSDIPFATRWDSEIRQAIADRPRVVLLASNDAANSTHVAEELTEAARLGKSITPIRLTGHPGDLPAEWEALNMIEHGAADYWGTLRKLVNSLDIQAPKLDSLIDLMHRPGMTVAEAARLLDNPVPIRVVDREYYQLPVEPSAYGMTWLFAPAGSPLKKPDSLAVLFIHTSAFPGARYKETIKHWAKQIFDPCESVLSVVNFLECSTAGKL